MSKPVPAGAYYFRRQPCGPQRLDVAAQSKLVPRAVAISLLPIRQGARRGLHSPSPRDSFSPARRVGCALNSDGLLGRPVPHRCIPASTSIITSVRACQRAGLPASNSRTFNSLSIVPINLRLCCSRFEKSIDLGRSRNLICKQHRTEAGMRQRLRPRRASTRLYQSRRPWSCRPGRFLAFSAS